jgi:hypothetical protein
MRRTWIWAVVVLVAIGATLPIACSNERETFAEPEDPEAGLDGGFQLDGEIDPGSVSALEIDPSSATIVVRNGDVTGPNAAVGMTAIATFADGSKKPVSSCVWSVDREDVGAMTGATFKASGGAGGVATVQCSAYGRNASAKITVDLEDLVDDGTALDDATKTSLVSSVTTDPQLKSLLYPYDATVFPKGLAAPELMWTGLGASDVYALRLETPGFRLTRFFTAAPPARATIPAASWTRLLDTAVAGGKVTMALHRLAGGAGGTAFKSVTQTWTIANANLKGTIYYWSIAKGTVLRIRSGANQAENFLKPSVPNRCFGCHSVSKNGAVIAGGYDGSFSQLGTFDSATGNEIYDSTGGVRKPTDGTHGKPTGFVAISPDGALVLGGQSSSRPLELWDAKTGASYEPSGIAAAGANAAMPTWSQGGGAVAFSLRQDGSWLDFTKSDLAVAPFDPTTKKFGAHKIIRPSGGRAMIYPSFSPDDQWIAYQDGPMARTRGTKATLHLVKTDGSGDTLLAKAVNAGVAEIDKDLAYEPTFNPVLQGGYFWLVFVSERQFGNRLNKTLSADEPTCRQPNWANTPCRHKQLWVTAIDANPTPGVDPSHPAFWLPGQELGDQNMRGYWALDPCKQLGEGCEAGFECCDGTCRTPEGGGPKVCAKPPAGACAQIGDKCVQSTDCCDAATGIECVGGVCGRKGPA